MVSKVWVNTLRLWQNGCPFPDVILKCIFSNENCNNLINSLRPRRNGHHFPDDIFKWIFLNENVWMLIKISLKFVPKGLINNIPAFVQIMAWCRPGGKPLSETMMDSLLLYICIARTQWVKISLKFAPQSTIKTILSMVHIMAWHRSGDKPSLMMHICVTLPQWDSTGSPDSTKP